jgi:hypothetical protein
MVHACIQATREVALGESKASLGKNIRTYLKNKLKVKKLEE